MTSGEVVYGELVEIDLKNNCYVLKDIEIKEKQSEFVNNSDTKEIKFQDVTLMEIKDRVIREDILNEEINKILENNMEIDSKLKKNTKFKDDFETFKAKIINENLQFNPNKPQSDENVNLEDEISNSGEKLMEKKCCNIEDQFILNKNIFNVNSTYLQEDYTTSLDQNNITEEMKLKAERIQQSILNDSNKSAHIMEERGIDFDDKIDEEFKYSTVYRESLNYRKSKAPLNRTGTTSNNLIKYLCIFFLVMIIAVISAYFIHLKKNNDTLDTDDEYEYVTYDENIDENNFYGETSL